MPFAINFTSDLTVAQYNEIWDHLRAQGADHPAGRLSHVGFEKDGSVRVVDIWDSMEDFEKFGQTLLPIIEKIGGTVTPDVTPTLYYQGS